MDNQELQEDLDKIEDIVGKGDDPTPPEPDDDLTTLTKSISNIKGKLNVNEKLVEGLRQIAEDNRAFGESIRELYKLIKDNNIELPEVLDVEVKNPVSEVTVKNITDINIPEPKDEVKITNLKDISDYKKDFLALAQLMGSINKLLSDSEITVNLDRYLDPKRPLSVRLSDGRKFYEAMVGAISMAGGTSFQTADGTAKLGLVDASGHMQVDVLSGGGGGTLVKDGEAVDSNDTGQLILGEDGSNYQVVKTDADGHVQVDVLSGGGAGVQYTEGDTDASITGNAVLFEDAGNTLASVSASKPLPVTSTVTNEALVVDDTTTADTIYVGYAPIGSATGDAVWKMKKVVTSSGVVITWADGNANYDNEWDNRATTVVYS